MTDNSRCFVDSNIWFYALSNQDKVKSDIAKTLIEDIGKSNLQFSSQVINEVCINLKRKVSVPENEIRTFIGSLFLNYNFVPIDESVLSAASLLREKLPLSFWDSLIVSAAMETQCDILYSEDMQDGFVLDNKLKIVNPFKSSISS